MTIQETITLLNAGYTKSDIEAMSATAPAETQPSQQPTVQQAPVQQPAIQQAAAQPLELTPETLAAFQQLMQAPAQPVQQAPAQPVQQAPAQPVVQQTPAQQPLTLSPEQLQQLIQGVAVQTAGGTVETPPSAQSALEKMYESIVGETAKKEE